MNLSENIEKDIREFLRHRETDIALEVDDFGCLQKVFEVFFGRVAVDKAVYKSEDFSMADSQVPHWLSKLIKKGGEKIAEEIVNEVQWRQNRPVFHPDKCKHAGAFYRILGGIACVDCGKTFYERRNT